MSTIIPRFGVNQEVIVKKHWLRGSDQYVWRSIAKVEVLGCFGKPQPYYSFEEDWRMHGEDQVFASEEELFEKTGKKVGECF